MARRVFTSGDVTVELSPGIERFIEKTLKSAETVALREMRELAEEVRADAERQWYGEGGVTWRTGKSGDIEVVERVDLNAGTVTLAVGSTDKRRSGGKPVPVFVRRPGRFSLRKVQTDHKGYWSTPPALRANYRAIPGRDKPGATGPFVYEPNPNASDGKFQLNELVKKPVKKRIKKLADEVGKRIAAGG
jgi:hypothetical protein